MSDGHRSNRAKSSTDLATGSYATFLVLFYGLTMALSATFGVGDLSGRKLGLGLALVLPLVWISLSDLRHQEVPDLATLAVLATGLAQSVCVGSGALLENALVAVAVSIVLALVGEYVWARRKIDVLGLGDVKLMGAGILVVGSGSAWLMTLLAATGGIVAGIMAKEKEPRGVPFAPFIAYSIFVTFLIFGYLA